MQKTIVPKYLLDNSSCDIIVMAIFNAKMDIFFLNEFEFGYRYTN